MKLPDIEELEIKTIHKHELGKGHPIKIDKISLHHHVHGDE